jgi:hypothetical protein
LKRSIHQHEIAVSVAGMICRDRMPGIAETGTGTVYYRIISIVGTVAWPEAIIGGGCR